MFHPTRDGKKAPSYGQGETVEKLNWGKAKVYLVAQGRGKFTPPKPGGKWITMKHFPSSAKRRQQLVNIFMNTNR